MFEANKKRNSDVDLVFPFGSHQWNTMPNQRPPLKSQICPPKSDSNEQLLFNASQDDTCTDLGKAESEDDNDDGKNKEKPSGLNCIKKRVDPIQLYVEVFVECDLCNYEIRDECKREDGLPPGIKCIDICAWRVRREKKTQKKRNKAASNR